jgi:serine/threonine protein phosphatase PrpC
MALFENQPKATHSFKISSKINQLSKGQDHIYIDDTYDLSGDKCSICIVFDGHGDDKVIDFISSIPKNQMNKLLIEPNPVTGSQELSQVNPTLAQHLLLFEVQ